MENLEDDRKKEEEEYSDFDKPEEGEEEAFILSKDSEYPASLPEDFSEEEDVQESSEEEPIAQNEVENEKILDDDKENIEDLDSSSEKAEENIELDEDFKKSLENDLKDSKKKQKSKENKQKEFNGVKKEIPNELEAETAINLNDIEVDKPSNYEEVSVKKENTETEEINSKEEKQKEESTSQEFIVEDKKEKNPLLPVILATTLITFLLTSLFAYMIYSFYLSDNNVEDTAEKTELQKEIEQIPEENSENQNFEAENDSKHLEKDDEELTEVEENQQEKQSKDDIVLGEDGKEKTKINVPQPSKKKITETKNNDVASNVSKIQQKAQKPGGFSLQMPQPKGSPPENSLFTVQVFSSPSLQEAEKWIENLNSKGISSAYLSEQMIKDKLWYRVRFGEFNNKDEAIKKAKSIGMTNIWIDRVK